MNDTVIVKCNVLNALQSAEIIALKDRIERLEEAGDAMVSHAKALGMDGTGLVKRWSKAKEDKP